MAAVLTVVALPLLWTSKREQSGSETVAAIAPSGAVGGAEASAPGLEPSGEAFLLDTPARPVSATAATVDDGIVTIDVAPPSSGREASGTATYRRWPSEMTSADHPCGTPLVPFGERIVVTNSDNGYKVACENVSTKVLPEGVVIQLDTDVFLEIADLGDAPVPVQISW